MNKMIHLIDIQVNLNNYNQAMNKTLKTKQSYKEVSLKIVRPDGLIEERSCKLIDFLKVFGFAVVQEKKKEGKKDE